MNGLLDNILAVLREMGIAACAAPTAKTFPF